MINMIILIYHEVSPQTEMLHHQLGDHLCEHTHPIKDSVQNLETLNQYEKTNNLLEKKVKDISRPFTGEENSQ